MQIGASVTLKVRGFDSDRDRAAVTEHLGNALGEALRAAVTGAKTLAEPPDSK